MMMRRSMASVSPTHSQALYSCKASPSPRSPFRLAQAPQPCIAIPQNEASEPSTSASPSSNISPTSSNISSSRRSLMAAVSCLLLGSITPRSNAQEEQQISMASNRPAVTEDGPGPGVGPDGELPPLADRPGASGKQLLEDPKEFTYAFESEVPCNLRVKQYYELIIRNRPKCWQRIAAQIQAGNFVGLDEDMKRNAMADLRQAALYTPWAILQRDDYAASVEVRKGYLSLNAHIQDLQNAALMAAENGENQKGFSAERVQQAFILMSASLDDFLARIPKKYKGGPQGPQDS